MPPLLAKQIALQLKPYLLDDQITFHERKFPESCELNVNRPIHAQKEDVLALIEEALLAA